MSDDDDPITELTDEAKRDLWKPGCGFTITGRDWSTALADGRRISVDVVIDRWPPPALGLRITEHGEPDLTAAYELAFTGKIERYTPEERAALLGTIEGLNARIRGFEHRIAELRRDRGEHP